MSITNTAREQSLLPDESKQKGATLVLVPSNEVTPEILFLPRRPVPQERTWTGHMYTPDEASQTSGVRESGGSEFEPF